MKEVVEKSVIYETDRLYFRGLCAADIDGPYLHWFDDQEVCRFNSHGIFPSSRQRLESYIEMLQISDAHLVWAVFLKEDDRHIGNISLQSIDRYNRSAEFAVIMGDRSCWGHGYAEEAARLLCRHGFNKVGLHRIYCGTSENNAGMIALAQKLGMSKEGVRSQALFENGSFVDAIEFGFVKGELSPEV